MGQGRFSLFFCLAKIRRRLLELSLGSLGGTLNLIGSAVVPEFKKSVYDGVKNFTYGAVDMVESGVESIGKGIHQGMETVKSVGKNVSDFFNGGLKAASSLFG